MNYFPVTASIVQIDATVERLFQRIAVGNALRVRKVRDTEDDAL